MDEAYAYDGESVSVCKVCAKKRDQELGRKKSWKVNSNYIDYSKGFVHGVSIKIYIVFANFTRLLRGEGE